MMAIIRICTPLSLSLPLNCDTKILAKFVLLFLPKTNKTIIWLGALSQYCLAVKNEYDLI